MSTRFNEILPQCDAAPTIIVDVETADTCRLTSLASQRMHMDLLLVCSAHTLRLCHCFIHLVLYCQAHRHYSPHRTPGDISVLVSACSSLIWTCQTHNTSPRRGSAADRNASGGCRRRHRSRVGTASRPQLLFDPHAKSHDVISQRRSTCRAPAPAAHAASAAMLKARLSSPSSSASSGSGRAAAVARQRWRWRKTGGCRTMTHPVLLPQGPTRGWMQRSLRS